MSKVIYLKNTYSIGGTDMINDNIEKMAMSILDINGFNNVVVDPVKLANAYGIKVKNAKFTSDDISGMLKNENGERTIYVNSSEPSRRKRFTIAHELGHYFLGHLEEGSKTIHRKNDFFSKDKPELEANAFSAALLMNQYKVKELYKKLNYIGVPQELIIEHMASTFKVSKSAVSIRLKELNLINDREPELCK